MSKKKMVRDYQGIIHIMSSKYGWSSVSLTYNRIEDFENDDENSQYVSLPDDEYTEKLFQFWTNQVELMNKRHMGFWERQGIRYQEDIEKEKIAIYQISSKSLDWKKLSIYKKRGNVEYVLDDCEEYTYIFLDGVHSAIKIGKTKNNPELRLAQLKTANPSISILHVFPSILYSESELHQRFDEFRNELEWFFYTRALNTFLTAEIEKHEAILTSFLKKKELIEKETVALSFF